MQIEVEPKGWSDAEVDQALASLTAIEQSTALIEVSTYNTTEFVDVITMSLFFMILIAGMNFGYMIAHYFLLKPKDMGA